MVKKEEAKDFEGDLKRLEEIIKDLDSGVLPLNEAIALYEEGVALAKRCGKTLDDAEAKIEIILKKGGKLIKEGFEESGE